MGCEVGHGFERRQRCFDGAFGECVDGVTCEAPAQAACQEDDLDQMTACAQACASQVDIFALSDCLGDTCPAFFAQLDASGEDCMNCSFLRGENHANELDVEIGAGDAFLAGVNACATQSTPLD